MRRRIENRTNSTFETLRKRSLKQEITREYMQSSIMKKLNNHELSKQLVPQFAFGWRRPTPGSSYLELLLDRKVETAVGKINWIPEDGVVSEGGTTYPDNLICAASFDTTYKPNFTIIGRLVQSIHVIWKDKV